ncbi:MAG: tRNA (N6-threonylcarbamoyladenosine(37)-N6)-methyltransferase TrmO [Bacteroidales bacterium]|jgi:tRNA-Thr(GGU) m(6)t(6)A37 methyltransferase TsaA|nr:tRNA (N6-threonylcarbamoyladenosine(37)-N6)-methyltransferase TrmO [Bacteroidales bacterium]
MEDIHIVPIGVIYTPHEHIAGMPVQPAGAEGIAGKIVMDEAYADGLMDLDGFSHIILLYLFHKVEGYILQPVPFMDTTPHGVFATRSPKRPNRLGISIVPLTAVESNIVHFTGADMLNASPLIDIKPYFPKYDSPTGAVRAGWIDAVKGVDIQKIRSDHRFE